MTTPTTRFALNSVLRFDPTAAGPTLVPTQQWNLTADFPELNPPNTGKANLGFEGVTFVPDTYLVQNGFVDQSVGAAYDPRDYPGHGSGLFFAALENDGKLYAYALNADGTDHRVAVVDTGMGHVMEVQFDADLERIWALCDNTCSVSSTLLKVGSTGMIVPEVVYSRPAELPNVNIEGFAVAPDSTCVAGVKEAIWADDGIGAPGHEGHALFSGTFPCDLTLGGQGAPATVDLGARGPGDVSVAKKGTLAVRGAGFEPGEVVRIELHAKAKVVVLAEVVADDLGFAITDVKIPTGVQPGAQEIWLVAPSAKVVADLSITTPAAHP